MRVGRALPAGGLVMKWWSASDPASIASLLPTA
jgi:hypothetical protein